MDASIGPYLKDALVALASVSVVLWTGALVLKTAFRIPSTWGIMGAMDLLQSSFVGAVLALGVSEDRYQAVVLCFLAFYALVYGLTFLAFHPRFSRLLSHTWLRQADAGGRGSRWWYVASAVIFFSGGGSVLAWPTMKTAFIVTVAWMWIGMQIILTAYHAIDPKSEP
jgi:hypothetical protein